MMGKIANNYNILHSKTELVIK